jgi:hypothetical protein
MEATGVMGALGGLKELLARTGVHEPNAPDNNTSATYQPDPSGQQHTPSSLSAALNTPFIAPPRDDEEH